MHFLCRRIQCNRILPKKQSSRVIVFSLLLLEKVNPLQREEKRGFLVNATKNHHFHCFPPKIAPISVIFTHFSPNSLKPLKDLGLKMGENTTFWRMTPKCPFLEGVLGQNLGENRLKMGTKWAEKRIFWCLGQNCFFFFNGFWTKTGRIWEELGKFWVVPPKWSFFTQNCPKFT